MIFGFFTLFVALIISAVAAYYSIVGLTAIFSAAVIPIIIMGAALEVGKVTAAVWLKLNWNRAKWTYKLYLVPAVAFLMVLTSMGIFGFLSKAHSDQTLISGDVQSKLAIYDEKIKTAKENIEANRRQLKQMDEAVDQVMSRSTTEEGATKANNIRRSQQRDRVALAKDIEANQKQIATLNEESAVIRAEVRKVEAEVGPIKYIAAMIYGDNADANLLEAAVRWVIILIVAVFDPLALVLILAAQQSIRWAKDEKITEEEFRKELENDPEINAFFERGREVARALDRGEPIPGAVEVPLQDEQGDVSVERNDAVSSNPPTPPAEVEHRPETHPYLRQGFKYPENYERVGPMVARPDQPTDLPAKVIEELEQVDLSGPQPISNFPELQEFIKQGLENGTISIQGTDAEPLITQVVETGKVLDNVEQPKADNQSVREAAEPPPKPKIVVPEAVDRKSKKITADTGITADNDSTITKEVKAHFGIAFPERPDKGELYLRVDFLPSRLYKFNGSVWIEVDKTLTDSYVYNQEYIKFLIGEIEAGRVDPDDLSASEREQITEILAKDEPNSNPT